MCGVGLDSARGGGWLGRVHAVCLDLEGVLLPEFWVAVAESTGIEALKRTTRDEPDYDRLMRYRLGILKEHGLTLPAIYEAIRDLEPLDGAVEFTRWLVSRTRLIILSDTFEEFAAPLMAKLGHPTLFCHRLEISEAGEITGYRLRMKDHKRHAVMALQGLNFEVTAAGDSYNDLSMIKQAEHGIFFRPPASLREEEPCFPVAENHAELRSALEARLAG